MSVEKSRDDLFNSGKASTSVYELLKHDVCLNVFELKCIGMGVKAIEMD